MRIAICQSSIPAYRVPIFNQLAAVPDIELTVYTADNRAGAPGVGQASHRHYRVVAHPEYAIPLSRGGLVYRPDFSEAIGSGRHDLVILPWSIRYVNLEWAVRLGRRRHVPVVLWGHGYSKNPRRLADWQRNRIGREAAGVLLYTHSVADTLVREHGYEANRVFVAQNALEQTPITAARKEWTRAPARLAAFQQQHGLAPENTIIYVSRLLPENRVDLLIHGLHRLRETRPNARLVLVGDGPEAGRLRQLAAQFRLEGNITFTGAVFDQSKLAPWMLSASLFAYATNVGLSLMHAFGYGLPAVTSDAIGQQNPEVEALLDGVNGLFYRAGDIDDMVRCWTRLLDDAALRNRMGRAALRTVAEKYTAKNMVRGFVSTLALAGRPQPQAEPLPFAQPGLHLVASEKAGHEPAADPSVVAPTGS